MDYNARLCFLWRRFVGWVCCLLFLFRFFLVMGGGGGGYLLGGRHWVLKWVLCGHFFGKQNARGFLKLELPKFDRDYFKYNFIFGVFALIETSVWNIFSLGIENNQNSMIKRSSDFTFTIAFCFSINIHVKTISTHSVRGLKVEVVFLMK